MAQERSRRVVGRVQDLPPGSVTLLPVGPRGVGVYNVNGRYYALSNYCPHRGAPLCLGVVEGSVEAGERPYELIYGRDGESVRCPWHGWEFDIATGRARMVDGVSARTWNVVVEDGVVVLIGA